MHKFELDVIGQFYSSTLGPKQPSSFTVTAHLKEPLDPAVLQQAVNDLVRRVPFFSGRLVPGFMSYQLEILPQPPQIERASEPHRFTDYYNRGGALGHSQGLGHMLRVLYGDQHFTAEVTHALCDGRTLSKIAAALLLRYFELLGVETDKGDLIDCDGALSPDEMENAYARFTATQKMVKKSSPDTKAYRHLHSKDPVEQQLTRTYDAGKIKIAAKSYGATITEYILMHIFREVAKVRNAVGGKGAVTAMVPIDCRGFFPSETLRNFVSAATVVMPETNDFAEMARGMRPQFAAIDRDFVHRETAQYQKLYHRARFVPRAAKKLAMKTIEHFMDDEHTTGISNVGLIKLPPAIEQRVESMEFAISLSQGEAYFFSCASVGNALSLTGMFREEWRGLVEAVLESLASAQA